MVRAETGWDFPVVECHLATADPTDLKGLPFAELSPDGDRIVAWHRQPWLVMKKPFMLFFDEFSQSSGAVKNASAPMLLEQTSDGIKLPEGSWVAAASNRMEDKAGTSKDPSQVPNRVCTLTMDFSIDDFRAEMFARSKAPEFLAYTNFRPGNINDFDPAREINATPRQWEFVADEFQDLPAGIRMDCIGGRVGEGHAADFEAFLRAYNDMPNPDLCILEPETAPVPTTAAAQYAIAGALAHKTTVNTFANVCKYLSRMPAEFSVMSVKDALKLDKTLAATTAFSQWAIKNQNVLN